MVVLSLGFGAAACDSSAGHPLSATPYNAAGQVAVNQTAGSRPVDPDIPLEVTAKGDGGRITDVAAIDTAGRHVAGELSADGSRWHSTVPLAAGVRYTVRVSTEDDEGSPGLRTLSFDTTPAQNLLKVEFGPKAGTYGVGQPVTAKLSRAVKDKAARAVVERGLSVRSTPAVEGAWHWVDDRQLHFRPKEYWPANASIEVRGNLEGIKVGDKVHGAATKPLTLTTGDRLEAITDAASHQMTVKRNGEVIKTIPVTTGKPGFSTRNGVKVVLGREYYVRMRGTSVGIPEGSAESYDLPVYYATRVTWSGEYVHAAPWSAGSQGYANVSHGCTGMSTSNAAWFYNTVREGDIVQVINSTGEEMAPFGNGFGDWNLQWNQWREGSSLLAGTPEGRTSVDAARLRAEL